MLFLGSPRCAHVVVQLFAQQDGLALSASRAWFLSYLAKLLVIRRSLRPGSQLCARVVVQLAAEQDGLALSAVRAWLFSYLAKLLVIRPSLLPVSQRCAWLFSSLPGQMGWLSALRARGCSSTWRRCWQSGVHFPLALHAARAWLFRFFFSAACPARWVGSQRCARVVVQLLGEAAGDQMFASPWL